MLLSLLRLCFWPRRDSGGALTYFCILVPGPPQNLQVVLDGTDNSSVRLSWEAPLEPNGILVGYNIFAEELENGKVKKSGSRMPSARTSADQTDYTLVDLKPNTEYSFQVNAYNRRGDGKLTKAKTQKMPARSESFGGILIF